ncbi:hypothetical protein PHLCEN_2v7073 [Hermanssonia centrifuga]|uniref:DUF6533 domain-containing protein n=1 Tax=Hermanssonia centrifuga TaxID=98765 RepID=A0A2R6NXP5_9APHY|nr:hypothetical protein PHLCEN_2v7073 [Hermanssonia centrifuga]
MSLPDTSDSGAIIAAFQAEYGRAGTSTNNVNLALVAYEYVLTINQEIAMIWRRRWTLVTWLFMANRYLMIVLIIWDVVPSTAPTAGRAEVTERARSHKEQDRAVLSKELDKYGDTQGTRVKSD